MYTIRVTGDEKTTIYQENEISKLNEAELYNKCISIIDEKGDFQSYSRILTHKYNEYEIRYFDHKLNVIGLRGWRRCRRSAGAGARWCRGGPRWG